MEKNKKYIVKYNLITYTNKVIEDDKFEFNTKEKAKEFINTQVNKLTCLGLYKVCNEADDYVILNSHDKQYTPKIEIVENKVS